MAETGLDDLLEIMRDQRVRMRDRINASVSASRVSAVSMPGESEPEAITFLRGIVDYKGANGVQFSPQFRRECAAALSYWERRCAKARLQFVVPDPGERAAAWRRLVNGALVHAMQGPRDKRVLLTATDDIDVSNLPDPDRVQQALLCAPDNRRERRRQRAIDDPGQQPAIASETERRELLRPLARLVHERLAEFNLSQ